MAVKIRLKRLGKIRVPHYRIVVVDSRAKRDGRVIEEIGKYHPTEDPSIIEVNSERVQYWLSVGAQPTEPVLKQLKILGEWQKFKGLPGQEGTYRLQPKQAAAQEAIELAEAEALKAQAAAAKKAEQAAKAAAKAAAEQADQNADDAAPESADDAAPAAEAESTEQAAS